MNTEYNTIEFELTYEERKAIADMTIINNRSNAKVQEDEIENKEVDL